MKILFTRFPLESAFGGAEVQTIGLMEGLIARGHAVAFLGSCPILLKLCREKGIPSAELQIGAPPVTKFGALSFLWRKQRMETLLKKAFDTFHDIDAIAMISLSEKLLLTEYARQKNARVFWIEHDRVGRWLTKNPWLARLRNLSTMATTVVVSDLSKRIYVEELRFPKERTTAIHNGIDAKHLFSNAAFKRPEGSSLHIGCVARLSADKGVDLLLEAIKDMDDVTLDIVGQGRDEDRIKTMAAELNRKRARVRIVPSIPEGIGALYRSLDLFVLPSREHDPCPLAPAEAMTLGIATIVTDACGTAGYVRSGMDAIVVKAGDADALRDAIAHAQDPGTRKAIADAGRSTAEKRFDFDQMVQAYERLFSGGTLDPQ